MLLSASTNRHFPCFIFLLFDIRIFQLSAKQVQKMNQLTMEKDKELTSLKKKLEGMVKLNQALTTERSELMTKVKKLVRDNVTFSNGDFYYILSGCW